MTANSPAPVAPVMVASFYKFVTIVEPRELGTSLLARARAIQLRGTLLLAKEGLNASIAGPPAAVLGFLAYLRSLPGFETLSDVRQSLHASAPFRRLKVKYKHEIVTMGVDGIAPAEHTGVHVAPGDWDALLNDPQVLLIDARNSYEHQLGTFVGALDLGMESFREFPALIEAELARRGTQRVAMFCTGGIRCEKASAYLLARGCAEVYQLSGGILRYLEETPRETSRWVGECFVFDERVALASDLSRGEHSLCFACRRPLSAEDRLSPLYVHGESCAQCHQQVSEERRRGFAERRRQVALAEARHETHLGAVMPTAGQDPSPAGSDV
jgi:UPF0176 protein